MTLYYLVWPPRRFGKVLCSKWLGSSKRRTPTCLQDSLVHATPKPSLWTQLLILATIPAFYYAYTYYYIASNPAVPMLPIQLALATATEEEAREETVENMAAASPAIPLPTINVEDVIPHGKVKKGFQPLVKSPFIEAYHSFGGDVYDTDLKTDTKMNNTTQDPMKQAMTCINNRKGNYQVEVNKTLLNLEWVDGLYPKVGPGGHFVPNCQARHKVAILVPYTWHRQYNLPTFLFNIHPFLMQQNIEYRIFLLEQKIVSVQTPFNKGRLFNAGSLEASKLGHWRCLVFHDVDLLPLDRRILYSCPALPRHMCGAVRETRHESYFGGVTALTPQQYVEANGYSNLYWGWGGEDHDMFWRLKNVGYAVVRYNTTIAEYTMLFHSAAPKNPNRYKLLGSTRKRQKLEGLSTVDYKVLKHTNHHLYTLIEIDVNPILGKTFFSGNVDKFCLK